MKFIKISTIFLFIFSINIYAQSGYSFEKEIPLKKTDKITVDQFQNLYAISGNELLKFNERGQKILSYSNPLLGEIESVDVLNPLNPYVFFKDVNQLAVIDNRLNESQLLNLTDFGFLDVQLLSFTDQQNVWLYDQAQDKLFRFNIETQKITNQSLNITQLSGSENEPRGLQSTIDKVYLNLPTEGILVFDAVGAFLRKIPIKNVDDFFIQKTTIFLIKEGRVLIYNLQSGKMLPEIFSESGLKSVCKAGGRLYLFDGEKLKIYKEKAAAKP